MKKQATSPLRLSLNKITVARLTDPFLKDSAKAFTDQDTGNTSYVCIWLGLRAAITV